MKAKLARWRESFIFNKFRLTKNLLSCPHFLCHHGLVWQSSIREQSIQIILASLTLQRRKWGSPTRRSESCVPKGTEGLEHSSFHFRIPSLPPFPIPPCNLLAWPLRHTIWIFRINSWCWAFAHTLIPSCLINHIKAIFKVLPCTRSV